MTLSEELQWRGFIQDHSLGDITALDNTDWTFYHGFDASADSQTVGNLAAMMLDKVFMRHGHKAIILAGGATSLIGDPGGKDKERPMQTVETITHNVSRAEEQLKKVFAGQEFTLVNNLDWTKDLDVISFLRDIGKHYSMTQLVQRDYIAKRIGEGGGGISYTEFSYTLLQGMDYLHLHDTYGVNLQIGGSDQWGNCLSGVDLVRRARGETVHAVTLPLVINKATGKKFGKSEDGAVWLDAKKTSPYQFYQFWLNSDDEGVEGYLKVFTELDKPTVDDIMSKHMAAPHERHAQRLLAQEVTRMIHGQAALDAVEQVSAVVFGGAETLSVEAATMLAQEVPSIEMPEKAATEELSDLANVLVELSLAKSKSEARTFIAAGAIKIGLDGEKITQNTTTDEMLAKQASSTLLIRRGKNNLGVIILRS